MLTKYFFSIRLAEIESIQRCEGQFINLKSISRRTRAPIAFLLLITTLVVHAESLVSIENGQVEALPDGEPISNILVVDERLLALGANSSWIFDEAERQWQRSDWYPTGYVVAAAGDGLQNFLLLSAENGGPVTRIEQVSLSSGTSQFMPLPALPVGLASAHGAVLQEKIYVAGVSAAGVPQLLEIDLTADQAEWTSYDGWSGNSGQVSSVAAQNSVLLVTVRDAEATSERMLQWEAEDGWKERGTLAGQIVEGTGSAIGQSHALYLLAGDSGRDVKAQLVTFNTITGSWARHGEVDAASVSTGAGWKDGVVWAHSTAEGGPAEFGFAKLESGKQLLHAVDWGVLGIYLVGMLGVGLYFYRRDAQGSEVDFFLGGRSIPFWAAGISLYASNASSISYIAIPAKAFETNWQYLMNNLMVVFGLMFVAIWVVPLLRRLNLMSIFHYLETRFHPAIRVLSSALYVVFQLAGRMTIILFLPSLAISTVTGVDVTASILIMGVVTICYTVLGGMKAVIWTDVVQLFVMFGGTFFAIAFIFMKLDGGAAEFLSTALMDDKMKLVDWSFDLTEATIWGFLFLVIFDTVLTFPKDQVLMQRVLATKSPKQAGRSVWTFALIVLPAGAIFYVIGTALYVFYQSHPERMDPSLTIDATFPLFIAAELPIGVTGVIIAGIFAASMSTLSSILNSVATLATVDFYEKIVGKQNQKNGVRFAEIVTVVAGAIGIGLALLLSRYEIHSLLDLALELWGLLGGGFAGAYTLGMFTRRSNWQGVAIGVAVSIAVTLYVWSGDMVHPYFYLPVSVFVCIVVGYAASWLFPAPTSLHGLTIFEEDLAVEPPESRTA
jgi:SSS family solute:Na+ symporter